MSNVYLPVMFSGGEPTVGEDAVAVTEPLWIIRKPSQQSPAGHHRVPTTELQHRVSSLRIQLQ